MNERNDRRRNGGARGVPKGLIILVVVAAGIACIVIGYMLQKYAPTTERMDPSDYFVTTEAGQASVIVDGQYNEETDGTTVNGYMDSAGNPYLELSFLDAYFDDGYAYDAPAGILRYVTDTQMVTAMKDSPSYTVDAEEHSIACPVVINADGVDLIALDFIKEFTDITFSKYTDPYRIVIETAGNVRDIATVTRDTAARRFGGPKSKVIADVSAGSVVTVLENYGKWSKVLTDTGVIGCIENNCIGEITEVTVEKHLPERVYDHILLDEKLCFLWHQTTNQTANERISSLLQESPGINVVSPTWLFVSDNAGGISSVASTDYIRLCHNNGVQVWALVGNVETVSQGVDLAMLWNTTASRDVLINNLIAQADQYGFDGFNLDFEMIPRAAESGYREFIRELSLRCSEKGLVLSIANYVPTASTYFHDRKNQADYADYIIMMGYDEHYAGGGEYGSNASIGFVTKGIEDTLLEVPAEQTVLGMPFFTRVWADNGEDLTQEVLPMRQNDEWIRAHNATVVWDETTGQNYAEYRDATTIYRVWLEDEQSIALKLQMMNDKGLGGAAFWRSGQEKRSIWDTIAPYMR